MGCVYILLDRSNNEIARIENSLKALDYSDIAETIFNSTGEGLPSSDELKSVISEMPDFEQNFRLFGDNFYSVRRALNDSIEFKPEEIALIDYLKQFEILYVYQNEPLDGNILGAVLNNTIMISPVKGSDGAIDYERTKEVIMHELIHRAEDELISKLAAADITKAFNTIKKYGTKDKEIETILNLILSYNKGRGAARRVGIELNAYYKTNPGFRKMVDLALGENNIFSNTSFQPQKETSAEAITRIKEEINKEIKEETLPEDSSELLSKVNEIIGEIDNGSILIEYRNKAIRYLAELYSRYDLPFDVGVDLGDIENATIRLVESCLKKDSFMFLQNFKRDLTEAYPKRKDYFESLFNRLDLLDLESSYVPFFEAERTVVDVDYEFNKDLEELNYKKLSKDNWKEELNQRNEAIGKFFQNYLTDEKMHMEFGEYKTLDSHTNILGTLRKGSVVYVPFLEYKKSDEWAKLGLNFKDFATYPAIISLLGEKKKLTKELSKLLATATKYKDMTKKLHLVGTYTDTSDELITLAKVTYSFGDNKPTVITIPAEYIKGYRRFKGKYNASKTKAKEINSILSAFKKADTAKAVSFDYDKDYEDFDDADISYKRKVSINNGQFEVYQYERGTMGLSSGFGNLNPILKSASKYEVVKASITEGKVKKGQKVETVTGVIIENGYSGLKIAYKKGNKLEYKTIPYSAVYYYHFDSNKHFAKNLNFEYYTSTILGMTTEDFMKLDSEERSNKYKEFLSNLYSEAEKLNHRIVGFHYLSNASEAKKPEDQLKETTRMKLAALDKMKPGDVVKYVIKSKKGSSFSTGRYFFHDKKNVYLFPFYKGEALIAIPIRNDPGKYENGKTVGLKFYTYDNKPTDIGKAIETIFPSTEKEAVMVDYFDLLKDALDANLFGYLDNKVENFSNTVKSVEERELQATNKKSFIKSLVNKLKVVTAPSTEKLSLELEFEPVRFFRNIVDKQGDVRVLTTSERLISDDAASKELSHARVGDAIRFFTVYGEKKNLYFVRKAIITDIDEDTGFPIISYKDSNGRIKSLIVYPSQVEVFYKRIQPFKLEVANPSTGEVMSIEFPGREKEYERRKKVYEEFVDLSTKELFINKVKAQKLVADANKNIKSDKVRFAELKVYKYNGKITFTKDPSAKDEFKAGEDCFRIAKLYKDESGDWVDLDTYNEFKMSLNPIFNPLKYNFDQLRKILKYGSILEVAVDFGKTKYPKTNMVMVESVKTNCITCKIVLKNGETKPVYIFRTSKYPTFIKGIYNADYSKVPKESEFEKDRTYKTSISEVTDSNVVINKVNNSLVKVSLPKNNKTQKKTKKKFDVPFSRNDSWKTPFKGSELLSKAVNKVRSLYETLVEMYSDDDMKELGQSMGYNLSNARGFVSDRIVHLNADKATDADTLHELAHIIMPGIKFHNKALWDTLMSKIQEHPTYDRVARKYPELRGDDLNEEAFVSIFAEYYSKEYLSLNESSWFLNTAEFTDSLNSLNSVVKDLFNIDTNQTADRLGTTNLSELFQEFGDRLLKGQMNEYYHLSNLIKNNTTMLVLLDKLIREDKVLKMC